MLSHLIRFPRSYSGLIATAGQGREIPWSNLSDKSLYVIDIQMLPDRGQRLVFGSSVTTLSDMLESENSELDAVVIFVDELNKFAAYAYSEESGYITSSPFYNDSFQLSILLHLPALALTRNIKEIQDIAKINRLNLSGLKDEGIKTFGSIFTLSNEFSTETSEEKIIETVEKISRKIIKFESETRENYLAEHSERLEDRICRSYGLLKYARRMGYVEAMDYLSDIRLGVILSIIRNLELQKVNDLMRNIQWAHLQNIAKKNFNDSKDGDAFRASYLRNQLEWSKVYG